MLQRFDLKPFPNQSPVPAIQIKGELSRVCDRIHFRYVVLDPHNEVIIPELSPSQARQHNLWKTTCLELFFGLPESTAYWEVNLSPAGHWNLYRFDDYRAGMREDTAVKMLPFLLHHQPGEFYLQLDLDLQPFAAEDQALEIAISAVIETHDHQVSYWALTHPGEEADFHRRDSFILRA
ncbi:MAG: DOMON-like domain-containing protein [Thermosynechococcaceae cyanobacterium]